MKSRNYWGKGKGKLSAFRQYLGIGYGASSGWKFSLTNGRKLILPNERFEWLSVTWGFMKHLFCHECLSNLSHLTDY